CRISRNLVISQRDQWHADICLASRAVDQAAGSDHFNAHLLHAIDGFADRQASGDDVFDHDDARALLDFETAKAKLTVFTFHPDRRYAEVPRSLIGRDQATDSRADHVVDLAGDFGLDAFGERLADLFRLVRMHEHTRLLDEHRAAQAGGEDEMPLQYRARLAENVQNFLRVHTCRYSLSAVDAACLADACIILELRNQPVEVFHVPYFE